MVISPPPPLGSFTSQLIGPMENLFEDCQQNHWKEKNFRLKQVEWQLTLFHTSDWYQINSNGLYNWCFQEAVLQEDFHWQRKMPMVVQMKIVWRVKGGSCRQYQCGQTVSNNRMVRHVHYWRHVTLIPESQKTFSNAIDGWVEISER